MNLSENVLSVLKNYATINPNVVIAEGNVIKTISEAKNVLSQATCDVTFPTTFGIYDLPEFLSVLSLVDNPRLQFESKYLTVGDEVGRSRIKYYYSEIDMLTQPTKEIITPECEVSFTLDRQTLSKIRKASSVLGHSEVSLSVIDNVLALSVIDHSDPTSNVFTIDVDGKFEDKNFNFILNISNLKMIDGDYQVGLSSKLISHFVNKQFNIEYWVALEKNSTYGV